METTRREAIAVAGGALIVGISGSATPAFAEKALPEWGTWVTHYDTTGQAGAMVAGFSPEHSIISLAFDRMEISLQGGDQDKLTGSIGLAGHYPLALPDEYPLTGFLLVARGLLNKTPDSSAILTLALGDAARAIEWPRTSKIIDMTKPTQPAEPTGSTDSKETKASNETNENADAKGADHIKEYSFDVQCFSGDQHLAVGDPPKFPPLAPLSLAIGMHARRGSVEEALLFQLNSIDIVILDLAKA